MVIIGVKRESDYDNRESEINVVARDVLTAAVEAEARGGSS